MNRLVSFKKVPAGTIFLYEIDPSKINEIVKKHGNSSPVSYADLARILGCNENDIEVHAFANFLYFTLLYMPFKSPLSQKNGATNWLRPNRIKDSPDWINALFTETGEHKPYIGRVFFKVNDDYLCHPKPHAEIKAYVLHNEFKISTLGMYGPVKTFYKILKLPSPKIPVPKKSSKKMETNVEQLDKLRFLDLAAKVKTADGNVYYDVETFQKRFSLCKSFEDFRRSFSCFALKNDFQLQRIILALYFLEKEGKEYAILPCHVRRTHLGIKFSSEKVHPLALYANLGPKAIDNIKEFTHFLGLDYYYFPPTLQRTYGRIALFLACQVSKINDLLNMIRQCESRQTTSSFSAEHYNIHLEKMKVQANFLKQLLTISDTIKTDHVEELVEKLDKYLGTQGIGCLINLNLPINGLKPCVSNIFVVTMLEPTREEFVKIVDNFLSKKVNETIYYPYFRFMICRAYGLHRYQFDKIFARSLSTLQTRYLWRFYAVGRPGDASHIISPEVIRAVGRIFDHFKVSTL
jgi:hypothetical protein